VTIRTTLSAALVALALVALPAAGLVATQRALPWPGSAVRAFWPTFAMLPLAPAGAGDSRSWNGAFSRCVRSPRVGSDFACSYVEGHETGYVCLAAPAARETLSASALTVRVSPGDRTYRTARPLQVCDSALAARLTFG
jgi:hypothetical protein